MTTISVDIEKLKSIRSAIMRKRDEMGTLLRDMASAHSGISSIWIAASQIDFAIKFETWKFQVETDLATLDRVASGLQAAIEEAERIDQRFG